MKPSPSSEGDLYKLGYSWDYVLHEQVERVFYIYSKAHIKTSDEASPAEENARRITWPDLLALQMKKGSTGGPGQPRRISSCPNTFEFMVLAGGKLFPEKQVNLNKICYSIALIRS